MVKLEDILDVNNLNEMRRDGYIRQAKHPSLPLVSECYTKQTMFERAWNNETRICRGLIWNTETSEVVARPFAKFFNYGEPSAPEIQPHEWVKAYNKLDGSLGIIYDTPDGPAIATKNSFISPQAVHATEVLRTRYPWFRTNPVATTLVEVIYPDNRIVLDYNDVDDLFYLCDVRIDNGLSFMTNRVNIPFTHPEMLGVGEFNQVSQHFLELQRDNAEGVVIWAPDRDIRLKIKQKDYLELHKVVTGLNKKALWKMLSEGKSIEQILSDIPEELHEWAFPILRHLCDKFTDLDIYIAEQWWLVQSEFRPQSRKELAALMEPWPNWVSHGIWFLFDGDETRYNKYLWKSVKPKEGK